MNASLKLDVVPVNERVTAGPVHVSGDLTQPAIKPECAALTLNIPWSFSGIACV